ncbi:MAG: methylmalonyl-CoA mutase family protein [Chloroflexi bacterium]|nr:methylmalonyl-CoA mutase family protein [Chloroflexota bacterium]
MAEALFAEFPSAARDQWLDAVLQSLRGQAFDSLLTQTYEDIEIHPLSHADDLAECQHHHSLPGQFPYLRGTTAAGYHARPWLIAAELDIREPREFNQALREALAQGQTAITMNSGLKLNDAADMRASLADIELERFPFLIQSETRAPEIHAWMRAAFAEDALKSMRGCVGYDPLSALARSGTMPDAAFSRLSAHARQVQNVSPQLGSIAVSTAVYHDAGANAVQELALAIAAGLAYLRPLNERGFTIESITAKVHFFLNIGENFFLEIAKFRAFRLLWAQVLRALGLADAKQRLHVHARSGSRNKSRLDAQVNLLRLTTEALSAAMGGVDSIELAPCDQSRGKSDAFSRRLSRNLQLILQEELRLVELIDPAGGAWHVEKLTDQLARAAWSRFQAIEVAGGLVASLRSGAIQAEIEAVAARRRRDLASGDAVLVGVNRYLNSDAGLTSVPIDADAQPAAESASLRPLQAIRLAGPFEARQAESENRS